MLGRSSAVLLLLLTASQGQPVLEQASPGDGVSTSLLPTMTMNVDSVLAESKVQEKRDLGAGIARAILPVLRRGTVVNPAKSTSKTTVKSAAKSTSAVKVIVNPEKSTAIKTTTPPKTTDLPTKYTSTSSKLTPTSSKVYTTNTNPKPTTSSSTTTSHTSSTTIRTPTPSSSIPPGKRGLSYNAANLTLPFGPSLSATSQVRWSYNWYLSPCPSYPTISASSCSYNPSLRFIPTLFNSDPALTSLWPRAAADAIANRSATHLFSFNEPDACFSGSSCMALDDAVSTYRAYMQPFAGRAKLGAPAVTNAGPPYGLDWLGRFMGNCTGCTFDFVNVHWYSNKYAGANYFKSFINETRAVAGGRPIWVTEFALTEENPYTEAENEAFLEEVMAWMDAQEDVAGYAYFMDAPGLLLNAGGSARSALGNIYDQYWNGTTKGGFLSG